MLILPLLILVISVHVWLDRFVVANALAHEAARAVVIAPDLTAGIELARALERDAESSLEVGPRSCPGPDGCLKTRVIGELTRGGRLRAEVSVWMPGLLAPPFGEWSGFWLTVGHDEIVDPYRSLP